jgi:hypothetical protein
VILNDLQGATATFRSADGSGQSPEVEKIASLQITFPDLPLVVVSAKRK